MQRFLRLTVRPKRDDHFCRCDIVSEVCRPGSPLICSIDDEKGGAVIRPCRHQFRCAGIVASGLGSLGRLGACRSFIICPPILGMFGGPLGGLLFGGETLDYFRLAVGPENIDNPTKSGRIALSHTENGPMFGHATNMRLRRPGSSQSSCHNQTDPLRCHRRHWNALCLERRPVHRD